MKGGGTKVCDGVLGEQLFGAPVTDLQCHNEKKEEMVNRALLSEPATATHIADVTVAAEQSAQRSRASRFTGVAIVSAVFRDETVFD